MVCVPKFAVGGLLPSVAASRNESDDCHLPLVGGFDVGVSVLARTERVGSLDREELAIFGLQRLQRGKRANLGVIGLLRHDAIES